MRSIRVISLILVTLLYGIPLPIQGQAPIDTFALPDARIGAAYRTNLEAVLRNTYRLKLETDARAPMFRWSIVGGELPPGLVLRTSGIVVGVPRVVRDEPHVFQLQVIDLASPGTASLTLNFRLQTRAASPIRLSHVNAVKMVSLSGSDDAVKATRRNDAGTSTADDPSQLPAGSNSDRSSSLFAGREKRFSAEDIYASMLRVPDETQLTSPKLGAPSPPSAINPATTTTNVSGSPNVSPPPVPIPASTPKPKLVVDSARERLTGDKIRGPATIELRNLNILRYDIKVGKEVTFTAGPDLKLPFIPPIPDQPQKANPRTAGGGAGIVPTIPDVFNTYVATLNAIEGEKLNQVNLKIVEATDAANTAKANLEALVSASDSILTTGAGAQAIIDALPQLIGSGAAPGGDITLALSKSWPDAKIEQLLSRLSVLKNDLLSLPTIPAAGGPSFDTWYQSPGNKAAYDGARTRIEELQTQLAGLKSTTSPQGIAFQSAQNKLRLWRPILIGVRDGGVAGFTQRVRVGCGFAFGGNKETKVSIVKRDRLADPGTSPVSEEVVTVVCSSPLSVSAGFGFSSVNETEFVFVPSTKTVTANGQTTTTVISRFGFRNKSGFRTLPVLLLNTRIWEPNDTVALHLSTGAAVDVKTGQGGTDLEYIVGPSFSFWRSLFITPGLHIGRVPKLAGGFSIDQEVPTGISESPIEKTWKTGFVTTFTYKIR